MGLLSLFFKKRYPAKKAFPQICFSLRNLLEPVRKDWIRGCKTILAAYAQKPLDGILLDKGPVDEASRAFQILVSSRCLAKRTYVHPEETKAFTDLIYAEVFGDKLLACLESVHRYETCKNTSRLHHRVSKDMAQCFLGRFASTDAVLQVQPTVAVLAMITQMITAEVFADYKTVNQKDAAVRNLIKKQDLRYIIEYEALKNPAGS